MRANPGQPRPRPETLRKRAEIVKAAAEVFGIRGYTNSTLAEIAEQVGMTHAGVLHHFGSKQKLLLEVLAYRDRGDLEELQAEHIPDGRELFLHLIRTAFTNERRPGIVQVYTVLAAESATEGHPARPFFEERYLSLRTEISAAFEVLCAERGITDTAKIKVASAAVLAAMDGLQMQWLLTPGAFKLGEATEYAICSIVESVVGPGSLQFPASEIPEPEDLHSAGAQDSYSSTVQSGSTSST